jgi:flagellar basal body-associated protein FliL
MNAGIITLACLIVSGLTALITYLLSNKRRRKQLEARKDELEERLRIALSKNDTVGVSTISLELNRVRKALSDLNAK